MANPEHVALVKRGEGAIRKWRVEHPGERLELAGAELIQVDLRGVDLAQADLGRAYLQLAVLSGATLRHANLHGADLYFAALTGADLAGTTLSDANLTGAHLRDANLTGADLVGTTLTTATLVGAKLAGVRLSETVFGNTDLTGAQGLDACRHVGPSILDHRTLLRSGSLPLAFLRGCGLPEAFIEYLPSLLNQPLQYYSCFISYAHQDDAFAQRLHADLQDHGVRCWFAPEDLKIGDKFRVRIDEAIRVHDKLLLILSKHSVVSDWVEKEVETALERERQRRQTVLFPIRLDNTVLDIQMGWAADIRRPRHIGDFRRWTRHEAYQVALARLLRDLGAAPE